jgi:hypothetical protein
MNREIFSDAHGDRNLLLGREAICYQGQCSEKGSESDPLLETRFRRIYEHAEQISRSAAAIQADAAAGHSQASDIAPED